MIERSPCDRLPFDGSHKGLARRIDRSDAATLSPSWAPCHWILQRALYRTRPSRAEPDEAIGSSGQPLTIGRDLLLLSYGA
jgi:hypothetical protein